LGKKIEILEFETQTPDIQRETHRIGRVQGRFERVLSSSKIDCDWQFEWGKVTGIFLICVNLSKDWGTFAREKSKE